MPSMRSRLSLIHLSAWKVNSAKLDFCLTEFSEVHIHDQSHRPCDTPR
jgi:hypothetical protein